MADHWNHHHLNFAPAEPLQKNETSVKYESSTLCSVEQMVAREKLSEEVRLDPAYTFLMMVSAFSGRRLGNFATSVTKTRIHRASKTSCEMSDLVCSKDSDDEFKWLQVPAISGVLHLSSEIFGHIKEAQSIATTVVGPTTTLKMLMENPQYQTLFARLVALRMGLSKTLTNSGYHKDKVYVRLHREQTMVMRSLKSVRRVSRRKWTEPEYN